MSSIPPAFVERDFRKASASDPDKQCVRVARRDGWVELRDDKKTFAAPDDHRLVFTDEQFDSFLAGLRSGETHGLCLEITPRGDGMRTFRSTVPRLPGDKAELEFTQAEVEAFLDGVARHEFDQDTALRDTAVGA